MKRKTVVPALVLGFLVLPMLLRAEPSLAPPAALSVRLVTWNLENLFDETDDPGREDPVRSPRAVEQKLENLASVLRSTGGETPPEIVAVQEVETTELLRRLGRKLHGEAPFEAIVARTHDHRGMGVGILTTWRIVHHVAVDDGEPGSRPILAARLVPPGLDGHDLDLIVVHWKSMRTAPGEQSLDDERRRLRQARRTRGLVDGIRRERPDARIAVVGDFNADCGALSLGRGLGAASDPDAVRASPEEGLFDALYRISPSRRGTTHWSFNAPPAWRAWATLDHVHLSASLLGDGPLRLDLRGGPGKRGVAIHAFAKMPARFRPPADLKEREGPVEADLSLGVSDHFPVAVWLQIPGR